MESSCVLVYLQTQVVEILEAKMSKQPKKPTLKYLLEWAGIHGYCAHIYCDRSASVWGGGQVNTFRGDSLYNALCKAHKEWKKTKTLKPKNNSKFLQNFSVEVTPVRR